jgi:hypothetical protein
MWRYNSDGFDFVNSSNVTVRSCFLRNFDDVIVSKGLKIFEKTEDKYGMVRKEGISVKLGYDTEILKNYLIENCVIWCDWGRALEIGAETVADEYCNFLYRDCDIIHAGDIALDIKNGDRADVHDIHYENIRVEYSRHTRASVYQQTDDMKYNPPDTPFMAHLLFAQIYCGMWTQDYIYGHTHNITYKNIYVIADKDLPMPTSHFSGGTDNNLTENINISGLYFNGTEITEIEKANIKTGNFAKDIILRKSE